MMAIFHGIPAKWESSLWRVPGVAFSSNIALEFTLSDKALRVLAETTGPFWKSWCCPSCSACRACSARSFIISHMRLGLICPPGGKRKRRKQYRRMKESDAYRLRSVETFIMFLFRLFPQELMKGKGEHKSNSMNEDVSRSIDERRTLLVYI